MWMLLNWLKKIVGVTVFGLVFTGISFSQGVVYRVGENNTLMYTNLPSYKSTAVSTYSIPNDAPPPKERQISPEHLTSPSRSTTSTSRPAPATPAWGEAIRINPKHQAQRDQGRRQILEDELAEAQRALSEAQNKRDDAKVSRLQSDITALRREISLAR
jgi:hypothetical protein